MDDAENIKPEPKTPNEDSAGAADPVMMTESARQRPERYFPSVINPLLMMVVSVFLVEVFIEYSLAKIVNQSLLRHILVDAGSTILLLFPIFYFCLYRPFKKLDAARSQTQYENRLLSRKLIRRTEEEKLRLARDLHDDFGQVLTALQFGVATLKETCKVPEGQTLDCAHQVDKLTQMISDLGDQVRSFTLDLRPAALDELGLPPAIQMLTEGNWGKLKINLVEQGTSFRCTPETELAIFRICQEALNNVFKHAHATQADICLSYKDTELQLRISDNGVGFDIEALRPVPNRRQGFGLLGLRERVASLGGDLQLTSTPGSGTTIQIQVPAEQQWRHDETDSDSDRR